MIWRAVAFCPSFLKPAAIEMMKVHERPGVYLQLPTHLQRLLSCLTCSTFVKAIRQVHPTWAFCIACRAVTASLQPANAAAAHAFKNLLSSAVPDFPAPAWLCRVQVTRGIVHKSRLGLACRC